MVDSYGKRKKALSGYIKDDIDSAIKVIIYRCNKNGSNQDVTDIPYDLLNACIDVISDENGADVNLYRYWDDYVD